MVKQKILPASTNLKDFELFLRSDYEVGVFLELHISQLKHVSKMAQSHQKKMIFHVDLINGIKSDEYATEYICQEFKPYGLISTKTNVIVKAKQKGVVSIQRLFLLDSHALEKSFRLVEKTKPDYIEVLPGIMPWMIPEIKERVHIPIFAGGLIRTAKEVDNALQAGASAITTSNKKLWEHYGHIVKA